MKKMKVAETSLPGVVIFEPDLFRDDRGYFMETWNAERYRLTGISEDFVQDNVSFSHKRVLRGLHYQEPRAQGKLVYVLYGEVFDVAVDIRMRSPTFGKWTGAVLSADNKRQMFVPAGFAHGFLVMSEAALFVYKCTEQYAPALEGSVLWEDPDIGIKWPLRNPILSKRDANAPRLRDIDNARLPTYRTTS